MASLGQFLQRERELRGVTLNEIASSTKINMKFLQALEDDNHEILPGEFFIKGIIRSYSRSIGLEEDYVLNKYFEEILFKNQPQKPEPKKEKSRPGIMQRKNKFLNYIFFSIFIILVIISVYFISRPGKTTVPPPETKVTPAVQEEAAPLPVEPKVEEKEIRELNLGLAFHEDTWIQVYADGELVIDGIKTPGQEEKVRALQELVINLGNAGGVAFSLNGKEGKPFGRSGAVRKNIKITLENFSEFLIQKEEIR